MLDRPLGTAGAVLLLAGSLALTACNGAQARHDSFMKRGNDYFAAENFEKARIEFGNALQIDPKDAEARYMSGRVAEKLGKLRDAVGSYQSALDIDKDHIQARANLGRVFVFAGASAQALETIGPGLEAHPDDADLLVVRGAARMTQKQLPEALADAERAVKIAPTNESAVALLASLYRQQDPKRAEALLKSTIANIPKTSELRQVLALLYTQSGDIEAAAEQYEQLIKLKPDVAQYRVQLSLLYARAGRIDAAEKALLDGIAAHPKKRDLKLAYVELVSARRSGPQGEQALRGFIDQDPKDLELQLTLGTLLERMSKLDDARAVYARLVKEQGDRPQGISARTRIAALDMQAGHPDAARKLIEEVLEKNPRDADALILRGNLALERNDATAAIADLRTVLRDQPESVGVIRVLARAHLQNGEPPLAEEQLRRALLLAPDSVDVRNDLARLLDQTNRRDEAIQIAEDAVRMSPKDVEAREILARLYVQTGKLDQARGAAQDLKTLRPDLSIGYYLAGSVAAAQKHDAEARADLEKALALQPSAIDVLTMLTRLDIAANRGTQAQARLESLAEKDPRNALVRNMLGEIRMGARDFAGATSWFEQALAIAPAWPLAHRNLGLIHIARKDFDGAIAVYRKALDATNYDPQIVAALSSLLEQRGRHEEAISLFEKLIVVRPKLALAANNLAMLLVTYRTDADSLTRARDLTAPFASATDGNLLDTFGWVRFKRGEQAEGLSALERAAELLPQSRPIRYHLAMAQIKAGLHDKARGNLQVSLEGNAAFPEADQARAALDQLSRSKSAG